MRKPNNQLALKEKNLALLVSLWLPRLIIDKREYDFKQNHFQVFKIAVWSYQTNPLGSL